MAENKMNWLIDNINCNNINYIIANTNRSHGAISCPTGYGKSSIIFLDMIHHILESKNNDEKLILNLSTPIIKLCAQQGVDFLMTLEGVYKNLGINKNEIVVFNNNSADVDKTYINEESNILIDYGYDCFPFNRINDYFIDNDDYKIALVISCHKSMPRFINYFKKNTVLNTKIITYLDEAHTIAITNEASNDNVKIDINSLGNICNNLYLVSATNKQNIVKIVNSFNTGTNDDDSYIYEVKPSEAIEKNIICSPIIGYNYADKGEITASICRSFMKQVCNANNKINHKILVTCSDTEQVRKLKTNLMKMGYTVFSTCSKDGMKCEATDFNDMEFSNGKPYNNIKAFIEAINEYKGHCFVLHIRQMISGIDVSNLTDAIISKADTDNFNSYDTIIQIIGRTLRLGEERGIEIEKRNKKYSNVLFVTTTDNENVNNHLNWFFIRYYGLGNIKFTKNFSSNKLSTSDNEHVNLHDSSNLKDGNSSYDYKEILLNIEEYIKTVCIEHKKFNEELGFKYDEMLKEDIDEMEKKYDIFSNGSCYLIKYYDNKDLKNDINKLLKKYEII